MALALVEYSIYVQQTEVIEKYSQSGIIVQQNLTHISPSNLTSQPCQVIPQHLISRNMLEKSLPIVPQYLSEQFAQYFDDGQFIGFIPNIVSFVNLDNDVIILTNQAELIYVRFLNDTFVVSDKITLNVNQTILQYRVFMETIDQELIIIMHTHTIGITIDIDAQRIFKKSYRIYESFNTRLITSIAIVNNMLFIAMGTNGIKMFQLHNQVLGYIEWDFQVSNITDLKVFNQKDVYFVYLLDYDLGVTSYVYNPKTALIYSNDKLSNIPYTGDILEIYGNVMMIGTSQNEINQITEIYINYTDFTWRLVNTHTILNEIIDIDIVDHIAIVLSKNSNYIIFHSIPPQYEIPQQQIIMPSLQKLNFIKYDDDIYIIGVSLHRFYFSKLEFQASYLVCYFNSEQQVSLSYQHTSTQCSQKNDQLCQYKQEYLITSITPVLTTEYNIQIYVVLAIVVFAFLLVVTIMLKEFKKYNEFVTNLEPVCPKSNEVTMQTFESPTKIIKFNQTGSHTSQFSILSNINRMQNM